MAQEHSKNFYRVQKYYNDKFWNIQMVKNAVNNWITPDEYEEITGESYIEK